MLAMKIAGAEGQDIDISGFTKDSTKRKSRKWVLEIRYFIIPNPRMILKVSLDLHPYHELVTFFYCRLECNSECAILERNKRLALALEIKNPDLSNKLGNASYTPFLKEYGRWGVRYLVSKINKYYTPYTPLWKGLRLIQKNSGIILEAQIMICKYFMKT